MNSKNEVRNKFTQQSDNYYLALFNLKTNLNPRQYLINMKVYPSPELLIFESYLIQTFLDEDNTESFRLGFSNSLCCSLFRNINSFIVQTDQTVYLKFDLITYDGVIILWNGKPKNMF
nr:hypothetical protein [Acinetobacter sp. Marseille-Q1620]